MNLLFKKTSLVTAEQALPGRKEAMQTAVRHFVNGHPIVPPFPESLRQAIFGMGCFWGVERKYWLLPGVFSSAAGYAGGFTPNPSYKEVCSGQTAHAEVVLVVFNPEQISYQDLLTVFWEAHDPTQGLRQGNDIGSQYRSVIFTFNQAQQAAAEQSKQAYQQLLTKAGFGQITTEIRESRTFYHAEDEHQQYLAKNPSGYCGLQGLGIKCA
ncbi:MAG: peptide-methionine (S)-S-oxide reductase MsrA [Methylomonas sp.]|jgi:peptide-methionine (S)-S-oxide reductase